jgi:hypothetical protein
MVQPSGRGPDHLGHTPDVDEYLTAEQEAQLRTTPAYVAWHWQTDHGCEDPDCIRCRVGRALAVLSKTVIDGESACDVLCALIVDMTDEAKAGASPATGGPDIIAYNEACVQLIKALKAVGRSGLKIAKTMGGPAPEPDTHLTLDPDKRLN